MRKSIYKTIEDAAAAASLRARQNGVPYAVIADQSHDGGFCIGTLDCIDQKFTYINVRGNGDRREGPAAATLPINFTGSL